MNADHGIQVVWLSVDNASDLRLRFLPIVTDPNYFSTPEVERLLRVWWRGSTNASIAAVVARAPMPDVIPQKRTAAGFVFTHREGGLKLFEVGFETDRQMMVSSLDMRRYPLLVIVVSSHVEEATGLLLQSRQVGLFPHR